MSREDIISSLPWQMEISFAWIAGVAMAVYGLVGIFGAARWGYQTEGDVLVNTWLGGRADGIMSLAMACYLSISVPPMQVNVCPNCWRLGVSL